MSELVKFNVYDNNGDLYSTYVTQKEFDLTEGNAARTLWLLNRLKKAGQKPETKWDESNDSSVSAADLSEWLPAQPAQPAKPVQVQRKGPTTVRKLEYASTPPLVSGVSRATGKNGGEWGRGPEKTSIFLDVCIPYAEHLQCRSVPKDFWQHISDVLFAMDPLKLNFSHDQLREKMRLLKNYYRQKKEGKHGTSEWEHQKKMKILFDNVQEEESTCDPSISHGLQDVYATEYKAHDISSVGLQLEDQSTYSGSESSHLGTAVSNLLIAAEPLVNVPSATDVRVIDMPSISSSENVTGTMEHLVINVPSAADASQMDMPSISGLETIFVNELGVSLLTGNETQCDSSVGSNVDSDSTFTVAPVFNARRAVSSSTKICYSISEDVNGNVSKGVPQLNEEAIALDYDDLQPSGFMELESTEKHNAVENDDLPTRDTINATTAGNVHLDSASDTVQQQEMQMDSSFEIVLHSRKPFLIENRIANSENVKSTQSEVVKKQSCAFLRKPELGVNPTSERVKDMGSEIHLDKSTYSQFDRTEMLASTPSDAICSPARKKKSSGPVFSPRKANRLSRTPKRKIGAYHLVWERDVTEKFVDACVLRKKDLSVDDVPAHVWKDISAELIAHGIEKDWQVVRAKYENMSKYFQRLLVTDGMVNDILWPYYAKFCKIYEIDEGFKVLGEVEEQPDTPRRANRIWTPDRERLLIVLYGENKPKFDATKCPIRHTILYNMIAEQMNLHEIPVSAAQCKDHMNTLVDLFRQEYDQCNKTGGGAPQFQFYEEMMNIFNGCPTLEAPVSVSVGRGLMLSRNGAKEGERDQSSRTRLKAEGQLKVGVQDKKTKSTNRYSTLQSSRKTSEDRVADEVRRMTDIYEKESKRKYDLFARMVSSMEDLKRSSK